MGDGADVFSGRPCIRARPGWRGGVLHALRAVKHGLRWSSLTQRGCEEPSSLNDKVGGEKRQNSSTGRGWSANQRENPICGVLQLHTCPPSTRTRKMVFSKYTCGKWKRKSSCKGRAKALDPPYGFCKHYKKNKKNIISIKASFISHST